MHRSHWLGRRVLRNSRHFAFLGPASSHSTQTATRQLSARPLGSACRTITQNIPTCCRTRRRLDEPTNSCSDTPVGTQRHVAAALWMHLHAEHLVQLDGVPLEAELRAGHV